MGLPRLVVVTGPTASGKSAYALELAERLGGEIVSADSMQVYRQLDVGTAKPGPAERARVRHHLIDVADPDEEYQGARFLEDARRAISDIHARGRPVVVAGGTALYLRILLQGLASAPGRSEETRRELEARWSEAAAELWAELGRVDPVLAARLHPNDRTRVIRGLEVWRTAGVPFSRFLEQHRFAQRPYEALLLGMDLPRPELYRRIDERTRRMLAQGWLAEVKGLLGRGFGPTLPPLQAIGYRQLCAYVLSGDGDPGELAETIARETRRFAKRQLTWFRRMPLLWVPPEDVETGLAQAKIFLQTGAATIS